MSEAVERVRSDLPGIFGALSGLGKDVFWQNQDRGYRNPVSRTWMLLQLKAWRSGTFDLITRTVDVTDAEGHVVDHQMVYGISGYKDFRVEVRIESSAQDDSMIAFNPMDDLLTGLRTFSGRSQMMAKNITLVDFESQEAVNVDLPIDGRMRSHAIIELNMRTCFTVEEEPSDMWIQKAVMSSDVLTFGGDTVPVPPNWKDLLIDGGP